MIFIDNEGHTNPKLNLALEEYALRHFDTSTDYLLFYINEPSIIIGRNQNTIEEINQDYIDRHNIHVVRRISGGGAVYHDLGNLNFSFITNHDGKSISNFKKFTAPVIRVLNKMGVTAELKGRNDILVEDKKISGTAQFSTGKRMISHGTLLFDTDMSEVAKALQVKQSKIESKGHKSVRSRVANISEFLKAKMTMQAFKQQLLIGLYEASEPFETYKLTDAEWQAVHDLKAEKYDLWEWNYGRSPKFNIQRNKRFSVGEIDLRIYVEKGHISEVKIFGDFFGRQPIEDLENLLQGVRYDKDEIKKTIDNIAIENYFGKLEKPEFLNLVYGTD
ncbi:lipoate-protein ligase [Winogradskyella epiphytica]|uniref:lipoate--protein ligase n=1 Tax=Winogradskyella epiphytica TaxID=262005 RepID=A0A2V4WXQ1_9FLAO|nr:lipoate--protein ligase [Winogradskyella epiphytica]PYE82030.1 lipoate-protein ligase [Winogradskyella epiphytica]GGW60969.1 lipoate--protein ligase [Winogradskyella epiphytica]